MIWSGFGIPLTDSQTYNHSAGHNEQHHEKEVLHNVHLRDQTLGFHPHTQKLESTCAA